MEMREMVKRTLIAVVVMALAGALGVAKAEGPGTCGKGKRWNPDTQSCEKKPRSPEPGSHS